MIEFAKKPKIYIVYEKNTNYSKNGYLKIIETYDSKEKAIECIKSLVKTERRNDPNMMFNNLLDTLNVFEIGYGSDVSHIYSVTVYGYKEMEIK